jgi:hypothetical protein
MSTIVNDDLDLCVRISPQELREFRPQDRVGCIVRCRDADRARRFLAKLAQRLELGLDLLEPRANGVE